MKTSMPSVATCQQRCLAHGHVAQVHGCDDCGCITVHMGPFSVRLDAEALNALWLTLGEAVERIDRERMARHTNPLATIPRGEA